MPLVGFVAGAVIGGAIGERADYLAAAVLGGTGAWMLRPGSGEEARNYWPNLERLQPKDEVKFVIKDRADFDYALGVIEKYCLSQRAPEVLISPVWGAVEWAELAAWVLESGVRARMQLQLHKLIWGAEARGV